MPRTSRSRQLLEDPDVRQWYEDLRRGNTSTAEEALRVLARFCREADITPAEILASMDEREAKKAFMKRFRAYIGEKKKAGRVPGYLKHYRQALTNFVEFHDFAPLPRVRVGNTNSTPTLREEVIPTRDELRAAFLRATPKGRTCIAFMAFAGVRPKVLGNKEGTDGLVLGDLPDVDLGKGVRFLETPLRVVVREELSKLSHPYMSFLGEEGATYLQIYLLSRLEGGEKLGPESPVVRVKAGFETTGRRKGSPSWGSEFVQTQNVTKEIRAALRQRPYSLRRYCEDGLMLAQRKAGLDPEFRKFWMGRKGSVAHQYVFHKGIQQDRIEEMREAYRAAEPYLWTVVASPPKPERERVVHSQDVTIPEKLVLVARNMTPELANVDDREKLRAFFREAMKDPYIRTTFIWDLIQDPQFKKAIRRALFEE